MTQYLTPAQVAKALQVSERTLRRWPIPRCKVGGVWRYDPADVEAYMRSLKQGAAFLAPKMESVEGAPLTVDDRPPAPVRHRNKLYMLGGR
jgi:hypothetical protein